MKTSTVQSYRPIAWRDGKVSLVDQTRLPAEEVWLDLGDYRQVVNAIKEMRIRGAPAIGVAGAYALALAAVEAAEAQAEFMPALESAASQIRDARPTGANLAWAVDRMMAVARDPGGPQEVAARLIAESGRIQDEDEAANVVMGRLGAALLPQGGAVLTHCNAGALATGGYGTALGVVRAAWADGRISRVYATETRPLLQGARLTAWELVQAKIDTTLVPDSAAGQLMRRGVVGSVVVGADRIAANGDVANKIGTYSLSVLAKENGVPFYVAAPTSTVDLTVPSGDDIVIEERADDEVTHIAGRSIAPQGIDVLNVAFDVTPHANVTAIVTEAGVVREPYGQGLRRAVEGRVG